MNKKIRIILIFWISIIVSGNIYCQDRNVWHHEIGINLLQIPSTTIDLSYFFAKKPRYTIIVNSGYTLNYANSFDFIGFFLTPHYKCGNNGYLIKKQSGGYLKIGLKYNFRKSFAKNNYFFVGGFLSNSRIYENAEYKNWEVPNSQIEELEHTVFVFGLTGLFGYNFKITEKLHSDFGVQISIPSKTYEKLYGYSNYIPGIGYMETCGGERIFPLIVLNLKYRLNKRKTPHNN